MKKWMYLIFPGLMLGIFLIFYISSEKRMQEDAQQKAEAKARTEAEDARRKDEAEKAAKIASAKRAEEAKQEERQKEEARRNKYLTQLHGVQATEAKAKAEADEHAKAISELQVELDSLHRKRDELNQADFDLLKQVEMSRVRERNAELDIQRMVSRIAERATNSQMVQVPPPPPTER